MSPASVVQANPFVAVISVLLLVVGLGWYAWGALDQAGLDSRWAPGIVTGKTHTPPGITYRTTVVAGRTWTQTDSTPEAFVVSVRVDVGGEGRGEGGRQDSSGFVDPVLHGRLQPGDRVEVRISRTRLTGRLQIEEVRLPRAR